jgi:hypothetical protein
MTLTVRLPETIESQLTRFCEAMGLSKSQVVQTALKDWFAKPEVNKAHPLLAFAQAAFVSLPSANWAGPYSKVRLRDRVLASGNRHGVSEPVAAYVVVKSASAARVRVASKKIKSDSVFINRDKGSKTKTHKEKIAGSPGAKSP